MTLKLGGRYQLREDVDRYPHFLARAGMTGTLMEDTNEVTILKMDEPLENCEEWDNCIIWSRASSDDDPEGDLEAIPDGPDEEAEDRCKHVWVTSDDGSYHGEGRSYCEICGADGDA
jgi:hypothetical protein